jgi:hypothetical protein
MTGPDGARTRGRPVVALIAAGYLAVGFWSIEAGQTWLGIAGVALGLLQLTAYLWPGSRADRFLSAPLVRRKRPTDR